MQTQVQAVELELFVWQDLKTAKDEPETANCQQLWQDKRASNRAERTRPAAKGSRRCDRRGLLKFTQSVPMPYFLVCQGVVA